MGSSNPRLRNRQRSAAGGGGGGESHHQRQLQHHHHHHAHLHHDASGKESGSRNGSGESDGEHAGELIEGFGTLALGEGSEGKSTFFGNAAGALFLLGVSFFFFGSWIRELT